MSEGFTDDLLNQGYTKGYLQGWADGIDKCINKICEVTCNCEFDVWSHTLCNILEELKEHKK